MNNQSNTIAADDLLQKDIFELLKLTHLSDDEKNKLQQSWTKQIEDRVWDRIWDIVEKAGKKDDLRAALDKGDESFAKFLEENEINLDLMFQEEGMALRVQLVTAAELIDQGLNTQKKTTNSTEE